MSIETIRILLIEDNPGDAEQIEIMVAESNQLHEDGKIIQLFHENRLSSGLERLLLGGIDAILVDLGLPDSQGFDTFLRVKDKALDIPIIVLSGNNDESIAIEAVKNGAQEYIIKGHLGISSLSRVVNFSIERNRLIHQLNQTTLELKSTELRLRTLIEKNADGIIVVRGDGIMLFVNPAAELIFDRPAHELIGEAFGYPLSSDSSLELDIIRPDKKQYIVEMHVAESVWEGEKAYIITLRDINERKQMEEQQNLLSRILAILNQPSQSTEAIEQILLLIKDHLEIEAIGIRLRDGDDFPYYVASGFSENFIEAERYLCSHDSDGEMIRDSQGNPYLECMCGNILCGRTNPSLPFFSRNGSFWTNDSTKLLSKTSKKELQARTRNRCNSEGYQSVALIPLRSGKLIIGLLQLNDTQPDRFNDKMIVFLEEVGSSIGVALSRKQSEEIIHENETLYRTLIDSLPQNIFLKNDQYEFVSANRSFYDLLGKNVNDLLGKTDYDLFPKRLADKYRDDDRRVIETGEMLTLIEEHIVDDAKKWVEVVKAPVKDAEGKVTGVLGIFWDITERKNLEEQLRQSQKMEAIGQLAGGIAHDFNNLLMVIKGNCSFASQGLNPEDTRFKDIEDIKLAAEQATALTRQLLTFSRRQVLQPVVLSINDLIVNMDKMLRRLIGEDIDLVTTPKIPLGFVKADPGQIEQIIMNLAVNARDAMPKGGMLTIETENVRFDENYIHCHQEMHEGSYVMLAVSDTGCGMDEKTKEHIFEPFFTTKEMGKGTGLGLATIYGIVKQSEGFIYVYSELGKGTSFKIYLPRVEEQSEEIPQEIPSEDSLSGSETILLVEDDEGVRQAVTRMLQQYNYNLVIADNGKKALEDYENYDGTIDLLLTDVVMPHMSGRELASNLLSINPLLKVLYMSGYTDSAIIQHGILEKDIHLIQKPFDKDNLAKKIRQILDQK